MLGDNIVVNLWQIEFRFILTAEACLCASPAYRCLLSNRRAATSFECQFVSLHAVPFKENQTIFYGKSFISIPRIHFSSFVSIRYDSSWKVLADPRLFYLLVVSLQRWTFDWHFARLVALQIKLLLLDDSAWICNRDDCRSLNIIDARLGIDHSDGLNSERVKEN